MFKIHFLGVRGSTPCAGVDFIQYGGHTSCVLVEAGDQIFVFDAGSGIIDGSKLAMANPNKTTHMFLSHTHLDHIMGFPFFGPFWHKDHTVNIYAGHLAPTGGVHAFFTNTFKDPLFPVPFAAMPATKNCIDFIAGASFQFGDVTVETHELNHPNGAIGYRLTYKGKSVCYVTDHEHDAKANRQGLVDFINGTDLFIYDSTYSDQNYESFKGWGHSTWQEALRLGQDANVRRTGIFHHDPQNTDAKMRAIEEQVQNTCPKGLVTRQGMIVDLT